MRRSNLQRSIATMAVLVLPLLTLGTLGSDASAAPQGSPWGAGYFPNVPLVTHEGKTVRFYDDLIKDKKVLVNFIYASCQKACPLSTAKLVQVQKQLGPRVGRTIFIYSITLDPEHDTPEVLKTYAQTYRAGPGWLFLTGTREDIDAVRLKLGERREKKESHSNLLRIGDGATGAWMRLPLAADIGFLVNEINKTLDPSWDADRPAKSYAEAPEREISMKERMLLPGQLLFQNRCATCHTFGRDLLGPDLKGITSRRDRAWLARFIMFPDEMRTRKDPIAVELAAKYPSVPMPNVGLTHEEAANLIDYLEAQDGALEQKPKAEPAAGP